MNLELKKHSKINGLTLIDSFVSPDEVSKLKTYLQENKDWVPTVKSMAQSRAVLQFGYSYPYRAGAKLTETTPIPQEFKFLIDKIRSLKPTSKFHPNQVIVNRYYKNQGITKHIDHTTFFGKSVCCLTVGSSGTMVFRQGDESYNIKAKEGSMYIMRNDARYKWTHEMQKLKETTPRYSITFRKALV